MTGWCGALPMQRRFEELSNAFRDLLAVAVDGTGNVWVGDKQRCAVYMLSTGGSLLITCEN